MGVSLSPPASQVPPVRGLTLFLLSLLVAESFSIPPLLAQQELEGREIRLISILGLERLSEASLIAKMKIRRGAAYDPKEVSDETGRLWRSGNFSKVEPPKVEPYQNGVRVIFEVVEKLRIRKVVFHAVDVVSHQPSLGRRTLDEVTSTTANELLTPHILHMDAELVAQTYRDKGYLFVEVDHMVRDAGKDVDVVFMIKEGAKVRIQGVRFKGNKTVNSGILEGQMATKPRDFFFGFIHPGYYERTVLDLDIKRIERFYQGLGFFEVLVAVDELIFDDRNENLNIVILVEEGLRYNFEGYLFEGNEVFSTHTLRSLVRAKAGNFYSRENMERDRNEILKYYKDRAYIDVRVQGTPIFHESDPTVKVRFRISESHEIYVDRVHIRGNVKTQDRVIRRELEFYPGEKFNWSTLEKSRSNLARLQIFQDVEYELLETDPNKKDVVVKVTEQATGRMLIGFGVTSGFGIIGNFAVSKRNFDMTDLPKSVYDIPDSFTGAGQTLNIVLQPGTRRSLYQFSLTEPYLFETRNSLTIAASSITIIRDDFDEERLSFRPRLGHALDFDRDLVFSVGARLEEVEITDIDEDAAPDVFAAQGKTSIVAANTALLYDKVLQEPLEGPYSGHREWLAYEYGGTPLGGHVDFNKIEASLDLYYPIYVHEEQRLHHVISLFSKFGVIEPHDDTDAIPIFERFFLGGPNTVRGFRFRGLGPHFNGDALGGTAAWYGNVEYSFPLFQKFVRGVLFFDYGNLETELQEFDLDKMRYTVGIGVRINFPFLGTPLPVGLYFGEAIKAEDEDRTRTFLFTIGAPF